MIIQLSIEGWGGWLAFGAAVFALNCLLIMLADKLWRTYGKR